MAYRALLTVALCLNLVRRILPINPSQYCKNTPNAYASRYNPQLQRCIYWHIVSVLSIIQACYQPTKGSRGWLRTMCVMRFVAGSAASVARPGGVRD